MSKDTYSDDYTLKLVKLDASAIITLDSSYIIFDASNTVWEEDAPDGTTDAGIKFNANSVFNGRVGIAKSSAEITTGLWVDANTYLRGEKINIGAKNTSSDSTITINPAGAIGGDPVVLNGNLEVTGSISGTISGADVVFEGDFSIDADDFIVDADDFIVDASGVIQLTLDTHVAPADNQKIYMSSSKIQLDGGDWENGVTLFASGSTLIRGHKEWVTDTTEDLEGYSEYADLRIKYNSYAAFSFNAAKEADEGDGPTRYIVDIRNAGEKSGNHRCLRLSLAGDGSGDSESSGLDPTYALGYDTAIGDGEAHTFGSGSDGPGGDEAHQDYFLVCSDEASSGAASGVMKFYIDGDGNIGITFTGQHWVVYEASGNEVLSGELCTGMIAYSSGEIFNNPKIDEALPVVRLCNTGMDSRVYGVMTNIPRSTYGIRQFFEFSKPYNERCRGDNEIDRSNYSADSPYYKARVNSVGEGQVWVTNYNGEVSNGDYITSSVVAGYGMRQDDDILHNYTVAKCVEEIDWASIGIFVDHEGTEYKKYLTACTYHCG